MPATPMRENPRLRPRAWIAAVTQALAAQPVLADAFIALHGDLGAGKTACVRQLLRAPGRHPLHGDGAAHHPARRCLALRLVPLCGSARVGGRGPSPQHSGTRPESGIPGRSAEWGDLVADSLGIAINALIARFSQRILS